MKDTAKDDTTRRTKKPYRTPELVAYGTVADLTAGGGSTIGDGKSLGKDFGRRLTVRRLDRGECILPTARGGVGCKAWSVGSCRFVFGSRVRD